MLISDFQSLGFTEYEARVYIAALKDNGVEKTAYEISKISGVPRSNTYSALRVLVQKDVVLPVTENPVRYVANKPEIVLKNIEIQTKNVLKRIDENLKKAASENNNEFVWILNGKDNIKNAINNTIRETKKSLWIKGSEDVISQYSESMKFCALTNKVEIVVILFGSNPDLFCFNEKSRVFTHEHYGKRMGVADNSLTIVSDQDEVIIVGQENQDVASKTKNKPLVKMALSLMRHDYYMSEIFKKFGTVINEEFGEHLMSLREKIYTKEQYDAFLGNMNFEKSKKNK